MPAIFDADDLTNQLRSTLLASQRRQLLSEADGMLATGTAAAIILMRDWQFLISGAADQSH